MLQAIYPEKTYPRGHHQIASVLDNLGRVAEDLRSFPEARRYYLRSLAMSEALYPRSRFPKGHHDLVVVLVDLGHLSGRTRQYPEATEYYERALKISRDLYPKGHFDQPTIENDVAWTLAAQGNYDRAQQRFEHAVETHRLSYPTKNYPSGHPDLAMALANLGTLELRKGEYARAWPLLNQAAEMCNNLDELFVASAAEAEAIGYLRLTKSIYDRMLSCGVYMRDTTAATYAHVWAKKAMIARMLNRRQASLFQAASSDPARSGLLADWNDRRRELARLILVPSGGRDTVKREERIRQLTAEKERLERQLADSLPEFAREEQKMRRPHSDLIQALSNRTVVLDFVEYTRREQDARQKGNAGLHFIRSYAAFVLAKGRPVERLDLGPTTAINDAVKEWRAAIVEGRASPAAHTLGRLVWEPIARRLPAETSTVVIVPDGLLTAIPWAALPGARPGTFLVEQYALAVAPHAPFVLDRLTSPNRPDADPGALLAVGAMSNEGLGPVQELQTVIRLARPRRVVELQGDRATTSAVLGALPSARWVHFDTHGFFANPEIQSLLEADPNPLDRLRRDTLASFGRNPLILSGLVLSDNDLRNAGGGAGAGASFPDSDKILTAEAIAGLPLPGLDLAVLSACETGLGTVAGGEGVFGLQRAFHLAGAQTVVASLWSVQAAATRVLMEEFYKNLWQNKLPKLEALRQAQLTMIKAYKQRVPGSPASRKNAAASGETDQLPPVYWAGFVLSGDWR